MAYESTFQVTCYETPEVVDWFVECHRCLWRSDAQGNPMDAALEGLQHWRVEHAVYLPPRRSHRQPLPGGVPAALQPDRPALQTR